MIVYSLYVIEDEDALREAIATALEGPYHVAAFATAEAGLEAMGATPPDLVLLDVGLPGMDGIEALRRIKQSYPDTLIIMVTGFEDVGTVISAMKAGAYDYLLKPLSMDALSIAVRNGLQTIALKKELQFLQRKCLEEQFPCFVGESKEIQDIMGFVKKVAQSPDTPVLILGETGTGKELIARSIHLNSPHFNGPMVTVNCAAIPRDLIESELFGYEPGAFSGARSGGKKGLIEEAANGSLFFDEVADLCPEAQAKLLRFLQDGEYYRVGGTKPRKVLTKVISATNKNVEDMIREGGFRRDLYYRLGTIKIELPSLNRRPEDILPLACRFLAEFGEKFGKSFNGLTPEAEAALMGAQWQGNIRELRNVIERGALVGHGPRLTPDDLGIPAATVRERSRGGAGERQSEEIPPYPAEAAVSPCSLPPDGVDLTALLDSIEKDYIARALQIAGGNECKAARLLHLNHHTFRYRRKKLAVD